MTRQEVRAFIEEGVNLLNPVTEFGSGLLTDFNSSRVHQYPSVWQHILPVSTSIQNSTGAPLDSWEITLTIAQKDAINSSPETYEDIIDCADFIAQKVTYAYRNVVSGYKLIAITGLKRTPFVKKNADCLTGVELSFTITVQDKTNVC